MKMTGMVDNELVQLISMLECKLAWLINIIAFILRGEKFTSTQMERDEELLDAELCKRVFSLNHSINYRMNGVRVSSGCHIGELFPRGPPIGDQLRPLLRCFQRSVGVSAANHVASLPSPAKA